MKQTLAAFSLLLALAACGTSPEPSYTMLSPVDGSADTAMTSTIVVTRPTLADYLDQPGMVYRDGESITVDDMHRWAQPLDTMFEDVLAADLRQRLPKSLVQKQQDYLQPKQALYIETEIQRFETDGPWAVVEVQIVIEDRRCTTQPPHILSLHEPLKDTRRDGFAPVVARLADLLVENVKARPAVACDGN